MTLKLEEIVSWKMAGFGIIGKQLANDPATQEAPVQMFTHRQAVGGKFHNGEQILTNKEERQMNRECEALIKLLSKFITEDDYTKIADDYNTRAKKDTPAEPEKAPEPVKAKNSRKKTTPAETAKLAEEPAKSEKLKPPVPIKKSVENDYIVCLEDGMKFKSLKRHLMTHYNMTPEDYKSKWGLPADYPMVAPSYSQHRSQLAKNMGLGKVKAVEPEAAKAPEPEAPKKKGGRKKVKETENA